MSEKGLLAVRPRHALNALCIAALALAIPPVSAQDSDPAQEPASAAEKSPAVAEGLVGAYLAARQARKDNDYRHAAAYYSRALAIDPDNLDILESAVLARLGLRDIGGAVVLAHRMISLGSESPLANLAVVAESFRKESYDGAIAHLDADRSVNIAIDELIRAWAEFGRGDMPAALEGFDVASERAGGENFGLYNKAVALALSGDYEGSDEILSAADPANMSRRAVVAYAQVLSNLGRNGEAAELIERAFEGRLDPALAQMRDRLRDGETLAFDAARNAKDGLAEVFLAVAGALDSDGDAPDGYALVYSRAAEYLRPGHVDSILLSASLLDDLRRHDLAVETFALVPSDHPSFDVAEIGRAEALRRSGRAEEAVETLESLAQARPSNPAAHISLGDALRGLERYDEASKAYDRAIALYREPLPPQWIAFFARGISHERSGRWPEAEADLRKALELRPDQPQVLNYLGYSLVEKGVKLEEALELIEKAVAEDPYSGHIVDSLGWALYRMGDYPGAVEQLERAAELLSRDPVINDHLGDAYWAVDRKIEAEFQWRRALSLDPEEAEAERIRRKLEIGLDAVLEEEGSDGIDVVKDG